MCRLISLDEVEWFMLSPSHHSPQHSLKQFASQYSETCPPPSARTPCLLYTALAILHSHPAHRHQPPQFKGLDPQICVSIRLTQATA